jgi:hypothetical protein
MGAPDQAAGLKVEQVASNRGFGHAQICAESLGIEIGLRL